MTDRDHERIIELMRLMPLHNEDKPGVDSTKRALAIELLVGPAGNDGFQTDRLCRLAVHIATAKYDKDEGND